MKFRTFPPAFLVVTNEQKGAIQRVCQICETREEAESLRDMLSQSIKDEDFTIVEQTGTWSMYVQGDEDFPGWTQWGFSPELFQMITGTPWKETEDDDE